MLRTGRKTRGNARYSPLLYFLLFFLPDPPLQSTLEPWSPGSGDPRFLLRRRVPRRPGVVWRFLRLAFLRQIMCTLCLYSDTIASANFVLSSCCIRALVAPSLY